MFSILIGNPLNRTSCNIGTEESKRGGPQQSSGQARLIYHLDAFKLAPDEDPMLCVRAYWTAGSKAQTAFRRHHSEVETDAAILWFARYLEKEELGTISLHERITAECFWNVISGRIAGIPRKSQTRDVAC